MLGLQSPSNAYIWYVTILFLNMNETHHYFAIHASCDLININILCVDVVFVLCDFSDFWNEIKID